MSYVYGDAFSAFSLINASRLVWCCLDVCVCVYNVCEQEDMSWHDLMGFACIYGLIPVQHLVSWRPCSLKCWEKCTVCVSPQSSTCDLFSDVYMLEHFLSFRCVWITPICWCTADHNVLEQASAYIFHIMSPPFAICKPTINIIWSKCWINHCLHHLLRVVKIFITTVHRKIQSFLQNNTTKQSLLPKHVKYIE